MWYDPNGIANILSLCNVKCKYHVAYDSNVGGVFVVTKPNGTIFQFEESPDGLHYLDTAKQEREHINTGKKATDAVMMVNTVSQNMDSYTHNDYLHAVRARKLQVTLG